MLEDMLLRAGVPYRIVGGTRFFDRAEIRDVMAYLTLVVNPADDIAAKRHQRTAPRHRQDLRRAHRAVRARDGHALPRGGRAFDRGSDTRAATRKSIAEFVTLIKTARSYEGAASPRHRDHRRRLGPHRRAAGREHRRGARSRGETSRSSEASSTSSPTRMAMMTPCTMRPRAKARKGARARFARRFFGRLHRVGAFAHRFGTMADDGHAVTLMTVHSRRASSSIACSWRAWRNRCSPI